MPKKPETLETAKAVVLRHFPNAVAEKKNGALSTGMFHILIPGNSCELGFGTTEEKAWELSAERMGEEYRRASAQ